jgi:hypothetical protein
MPWLKKFQKKWIGDVNMPKMMRSKAFNEIFQPNVLAFKKL